MSCGLYGKLPMKRDFISVSVPPPFLDRWEPWLQGGMSASHIALGPQWHDAFLQAPIWRFWFGAEICGMPVMGAFMPSVDGVGRFFPLTAVVCGAPEVAFAPPQVEPHAEWFAAVDELLLGALNEDASYDDVLAALNGLPSPAFLPALPPATAIRDVFSASVLTADSCDSLGGAFASLLVERERRLLAGGCFFWTFGGDDFPPAATFCPGLPDPNVLTTFLRGEAWPSPTPSSCA